MIGCLISSPVYPSVCSHDCNRAFINYFCFSDFNSQPDYCKNIIVEEMTRKIELLDVPDDFRMGDYFTEYGQGFLLVYSISDYQTFLSAKSMREEIMRIKKR